MESSIWLHRFNLNNPVYGPFSYSKRERTKQVHKCTWKLRATQTHHQPLSPPHDISSHVLLCIVRSASLALLFASWTYRTSLANKLPLGHLSNLCHTRSHAFLREYSNNVSTSFKKSYTSNSPKNPIHRICWTLYAYELSKELVLRNLHLRIYLCDIDYEILWNPI